ncbi:hypothetical protein H5410_060921, partial [Solanum commersonii]
CLLKTHIRKKQRLRQNVKKLIDAYKTTILSKDLQYFWTCINNIVYENEKYGHSYSSTLHKFIFLTDNILPVHNCSTIKKLSVNFVFGYNDESGGFTLNICYRYVDPTKNDQPYSFPEVLCICSSIIKLKYENCRILEHCVKKWIYLHEFFCFDRLHMTSLKCCLLNFIHRGHPRGDWYSFESHTCCFEILSPDVEHLTISGGFNDMRIKMRYFSSLNHANLDLYYDEFDEMDKNIVKDLLVRVCCAN